MIPRNEIVRVFKDGHRIHCSICANFVTSRTQKDCPKFLGEYFVCSCKYSLGEQIMIIYADSRILFDNTKHIILSTIYNCGSNKGRCGVSSCDRCNFTVIQKAIQNEK